MPEILHRQSSSAAIPNGSKVSRESGAIHGDGGQAAFSYPIAVPPGAGGMTPQLALLYAGGGINGPLGAGWSVQGISTITRCPGSKYLDGRATPVEFRANDKLCLDGQRLIQVDPSSEQALALQQGDAAGMGSGFREYRTEKDSFVRVRAYGAAASGASDSGPAYFKVWTKAGQIYEYGSVADAPNAAALVMAQGKNVAMTWAVARISDVLGNRIDFRYEQREVAWGSGSKAGKEWNLSEVFYSGNKIVLRYEDRPQTSPRDAAETYHQGAKNVNVRRLRSVTSYVGAPAAVGDLNGAIPVKTLKLSYEQGPTTQHSRIARLQDCAGDQSSTNCLPALSFSYTPGSGYQRVLSGSFNLGRERLMSMDGRYGLLSADFNGDGKTDLLRWSESASENKLWISRGDGGFDLAGSFSIPSAYAQLFTANGCVSSMALDVNGDGITDIVRITSAQDNNGNACGTGSGAVFLINDGNGAFTARALQTSAGQAIQLNRQSSGQTTRRFCGYIAAAAGLYAMAPSDQRTDGPSMLLAVNGRCDDERTGYGWTAGASFYLIDLDGDGRLDIVSTALPARQAQDPWGGDALPEAVSCSACTQVYLQQADGSFVHKADSNVSNFALYYDPGRGARNPALSRARDVDGDGLADLMSVGAPSIGGTWRSNGDGNFSRSTDTSNGCSEPMDFNGDGRTDCLAPQASVAYGGTLYVSDGTGGLTLLGGIAPAELSSGMLNIVSQNYGVLVGDLNGDGRDDLIRWHDNPALNRIYLSNGDGSFTQQSDLGGMAGFQLEHSDGSYTMVAGDFRGLGVREFLRVSKYAPDLSAPETANALLVSNESRPADLMLESVAGTGARSSVTYTPLTAQDGRYKSDRGTPKQAAHPLVDLSPASWVITTHAVDAAVGQEREYVEYAYAGMKADVRGHGLLGFREVRKSSQGANGGWTTSVTEYVQNYPYTGVAALAETRLGRWNESGLWLSRVANTYCDMSASTAEREQAAASGQHCSFRYRDGSNRIQLSRPFLLSSTETAQDPAGYTQPTVYALPTVVTSNTYNSAFDLTQIDTVTRGSMSSAGLAQEFRKTVKNSYDYKPSYTACTSDTQCNWILGRLSRTEVRSTVPNSLAALATSPGNAPNAAATAGTRPSGLPIDPAALAAILQLLLED
ncbi:UNVERIFIED_ORG: FG-GAP-like repeat-containing protein [Shinella sp. XGS7]|nr:VCBS repeat-containing protein [Shinella sp. XGS7]